MRCDIARAITVDGNHWQIHVICEAHQQQWQVASEDTIQRRYVLYGTWTNTSGLYTMPLDPMLDVPADDDIQQQLIKPLEQHSHQIPFPQEDHYELWALDNDDLLPMALLASSIDKNNINNIPITRWRAHTQSEHSFKPSNAGIYADPLQALEHIIHNTQHKPEHYQWFERHQDGSGSAVQTPEQLESLSNRTLDASYFPELLLRQHWQEPSTQSLIDEYHEWLAPRLLCLQTMSDSTREHLEHAASRQALLADQLLPLYPKTINQKIINKIKVEARLRKSS